MLPVTVNYILSTYVEYFSMVEWGDIRICIRHSWQEQKGKYRNKIKVYASH